MACRQQLLAQAPSAAVVRPVPRYTLIRRRSSVCAAAGGGGSPAGAVRSLLSRAGAAALAAAVGASSLLVPPALQPPPAAAHGGGAHQHEAASAGGGGATAASRFSCTPLSRSERAAYFDLGGFTHRISTRSPEAQALFDQGLLLAYNFNHPEALRAFRAALELDPEAPMLHWGVTYALSPYSNVVWGEAPPDGSYPVVTPQELGEAQAAAARGLELARAAAASAPRGGPGRAEADGELRWLAAAARLFGAVRSAGDARWPAALRRYAEDMEAAGRLQQGPGGADALALAAEARMGLSPWVYWRGPLDRRTPANAATVVDPALGLIQGALDRTPTHPLAAHLLIHLTEGATPGSSRDVPAARGYAALGERGADILSGGGPPGLQPPLHPQMGHLVHMPSHTYLRVGRWHDAVVSNRLALQADEAQAARCIEPYMPEHNAQLLQFAAAMSGELSKAEALARTQAERFPELFGPGNMADGRERASLPLLYARYGLWGRLGALPHSWLDYGGDGVQVPPGTSAFGDAVWHYTRGLALAARAAREAAGGDARAQLEAQVDGEVAALAAAVEATPPDPQTLPGEGIGIYSPGFKRLGEIQLLTLQARADGLRGDWAGAARRLEAALRVDGSFGYTEPPRQFQPLRPCLGWALLQQGRLREAEQAYRQDLLELPLNPWSLRGLADVLARGDGGPAARAELMRVQEVLVEAWSHADEGLPPPSSSCPAFSD